MQHIYPHIYKLRTCFDRIGTKEKNKEKKYLGVSYVLPSVIEPSIGLSIQVRKSQLFLCAYFLDTRPSVHLVNTKEQLFYWEKIVFIETLI